MQINDDIVGWVKEQRDEPNKAYCWIRYAWSNLQWQIDMSRLVQEAKRRNQQNQENE